MSVKITPADEKIEFLDNAGNIDAKISLDGSGNLKLENFNGGSMVLGDATADIYVGDGSASVDIVYDVGGSLYSTANQDITIGKSKAPEYCIPANHSCPLYVESVNHVPIALPSFPAIFI